MPTENSAKAKVTRRVILVASGVVTLESALGQGLPGPLVPRQTAVLPRPLPVKKYPPKGCMFVDSVIDNTMLYKIEANITDAFLNGVASLVVALSCPGGNIDAAIGIHNVLASLGEGVTTYNLSAVDSSANMVFQAGSRRIAHPGSHFLFHPIANLATVNGMNPESVRSVAEAMAESTRQMVEILKRRTKLDAATIDDMFAKQVIVTAKQALGYGMVDEIAELKFPLGQIVVPSV